jgi:hypothetical protein
MADCSIRYAEGPRASGGHGSGRAFRAAAAIAGLSRPLSALRIAGLVTSGRRRFLDFIGKVDYVMAVSQWLKRCLSRNRLVLRGLTGRLGSAGLAPPKALIFWPTH